MAEKMPEEKDVTHVLECAFMICSARGMSQAVLYGLGEQAGWARRALMARDAIAYAEESGDIAGAQARFDASTPVVIMTADTGLPGWDGPLQINNILEVRAELTTQDQLDQLMDRTADSITDDLVKKLGLWVALYVLQSTQEWDLHHQTAYEYMLARWKLDHSDVSAWWTDVLFPIVGTPDGAGVPPDDEAEDSADTGGDLADTINQSIANAEAYLTDPEASEEDKAAAKAFLEKVAPQLRALIGQ